MYSPSVHQSWLPPSDYPEIMKAIRMLDHSEVYSFFISFYKKLYFIHEYYTMLLTCHLVRICWLTWLTCWLILFTISNEAWLTCWLDSFTICWHKGTFIHQSIPVAESLPPGICHPIQGKKNVNALGSVGSWGGGGCLGGAGIDWCISSQDPRNLWLCLVCLVNNFDLPQLSRMCTPNWGLCVENKFLYK